MLPNPHDRTIQDLFPADAPPISEMNIAWGKCAKSSDHEEEAARQKRQHDKERDQRAKQRQKKR